MSRRTQIAGAGAAVFVLVVLALSLFVSRVPDSVRGAVVTSDKDPARELPIGDVEVTIVDAPSAGSVHSDTSGFYTIPMPWHLRTGQRLTLRFHHPDYRPLELPDVSPDRLCIAHLVPLARAEISTGKPEVAISNVVVKYSIRTTSTINVGSVVKMFQAVNVGNTPCKGQRPCSPDGKWKAARGTATMDAGPGNEFHNTRASCIAGPCPFTRIEGSGIVLSHDGRLVNVTALNWSDTATFLLEAEVYKPTVNDLLRRSYPVIFGRALTFTLPGAAEEVSIEAELNGALIVFPLGPALILSWANCQLLVNPDKTRVYRCELKPGYQFPPGSAQ